MSEQKELKCPVCGKGTYIDCSSLGTLFVVHCVDERCIEGPTMDTREEAIKEWKRLRYVDENIVEEEE